MLSKEISWNIVNSLLAGALVFLGGMVGSNGIINIATICAAGLTALIVAVTRFAEYWKKEESEYMDENSRKYNKIFTFI